MRFKNIPILDFHGKQEDEIFDFLDQFLRKYNNKEQVLLVVGKGKGIVKQKVIEYLKLTGYSWKYEKVKGLVNKGALLVDLL